MTITLMCAWCKKEIVWFREGNQSERREDQKAPSKGRFCGEIVSDGICADCRKKHFPETLRTVQENAQELIAQFRANNTVQS